MIESAASGTVTGFVHGPHAMDWGSSGFGLLLHLARVNHLERRCDVARAFGILSTPARDVSWTLTFNAKQKDRFCKAIEYAQPPPFWEMQPWQPFHAPNLWEPGQWKLRGCPSCFRNAYHTNLFQCPWIVRCPWHREKLIDACRCCGQPLLLDFVSTRSLLVCPCGSDAVRAETILRIDPRVSQERRSFFSSYVKWIDDTAGDTLLLHPNPAQCDIRPGLSSLLTTPGLLAPWSNSFSMPRASCHLERWSFVVREDDHITGTKAGKLRSFIRLFQEGRLACLPWDGRAMTSILTRLMYRVLIRQEHRDPSTASREREFERLLTLSLPIRKEGASVDPCILGLESRNTLLQYFNELLEACESGRLWWSADALYRVCERLVMGAYADGVWHSLQALVPRELREPIGVASMRLPWIFIRAPASGRQDVSIAWADTSGPRSSPPWFEDPRSWRSASGT